MAGAHRAKTFKGNLDSLASSQPQENLLVLALDREGRIISFNKSLELLTGYTSREVLGKPFWELFLTPEEAELARCSFQSLVNGEPSCGHLNFCRTKDGGKRLISWSDRAVADEKGALSYILKTGVDLGRGGQSGQEWWTQEPIQSEPPMQSEPMESAVPASSSIEGRNYLLLSEQVVPLAEALAEAVVLTDERGIIRYANPAFELLTGYDRRETLGRDLHLIESGRHDEAFYREIRETLRLSDTWQGSLINKKKDGALYREATTISRVRTGEGAAPHYLSVRRDLTGLQLKESLDEARAATGTVSELLLGLVQEIGNPINSTKLVLSMLKDNLEIYDKVTVIDYLQRSLDELAKVEEIIRNLKKHATYERQEPQEIEVKDFIEKLIPCVEVDLAAKGISLKTSCDPSAPVCAADPLALQQALLILLSNAADACAWKTRPEIVLSAEPALGGMLLLRIADNGCGMDEAQQQNLFKPFYTTKPRGSGLGLLTARRILARMNATLAISSKKGEGTVAEILIPRKLRSN